MNSMMNSTTPSSVTSQHFPQVLAQHSLRDQETEQGQQMARRLENLRKTQALMPQALNARLLLALQAEALQRELGAAPQPLQARCARTSRRNPEPR